MPATHVALIRGINVGKAKRVAMADLRTLVANLGYEDVKTLLNSGNVVFTAVKSAGNAAARIEKALVEQTGIAARVTVVSAADFATIVAENPLLKIADNPTRTLVAFFNCEADRQKLKTLAKQDWAPEAFAFVPRAAYLWCPDGILVSPLAAAVGKSLGDAVTSRNWATVLKLHALVSG